MDLPGDKQLTESIRYNRVQSPSDFACIKQAFVLYVAIWLQVVKKVMRDTEMQM